MRPDRDFAALGLALLVPFAGSAVAQDTVRLYAAGSLRAVMTEMTETYARAGGALVRTEYGASGLLRDRIAGGEQADVFASANMEHPAALHAAGRAGPVTPFARNRLCALVAPDLAVMTDNLLDRLLDPAIKVGTSTPKADPSGDYAFELFAKAEALKPGARAVLEGKALKLTGGPGSPPPPPGRSVYGMLVAERKADIFLTYCTNARAARDEHPALEVVAIPAPLAVGAIYGMTVMTGASPVAAAFARYVLSDEGRRILARHGFDAP